MESEGLEVVLSSLQLAAILENDSIDQGSCLSNRFWGAASVVGGAMELIGAAALFLAPEPTTVTKIAGGVLAVHGADTASAGLAQVVSCQTRRTLTSLAVTAAAKASGPTRLRHPTWHSRSRWQSPLRRVLWAQRARWPYGAAR